ncbi:histidine kinase [Rhodospirillum rubrum]|uniref:ATP-binding protein n=1 Tax=Rhodospirillum rubrum TaxID=1085 RepID=UPI001906D884|nr:ATP-binding protein [Rhodospirillum rubrum]MBK1664647.1 histidine kinase [Rhodospirillum rubrum]MBK1676328.1 histidine kinase [Rhodospirillum rubrum]
MTGAPNDGKADLPKSRPVVGWMTRRYLLALSLIALLALSGYLAFDKLATQHDRTLGLVNISGRQRMLSQRTALYAERLVRDDCPEPVEVCHRILREATDLLEDSHGALTRGSAEMGLPVEKSPEIAALYFDGAPSLDQRMTDYLAALRQILTATRTGDDALALDAYRRVVRESSGPLLDDLDRLVARHQSEGEAALEHLDRAESAILVLTLLTLLLEIVLIFRPMVTQIHRQFADLDQMTAALRRSRDGLEGIVEQRTADIDRARAEAVKANHSKSRFLAAVGHDLMQPLEGAMMYAGALGRQTETDKARQAVAELKNAHQAMNRLIRSILEISKLESGVVEPLPRVFALDPLLDQLVGEFQPQAQAKGLRLRRVWTSARLETDPLLLERILRNLLTNALRHTHKGGIVVGVRRRANGLVIAVADSGIGIAAQNLGRIFEEFIQIDGGQLDRSEGLGLGLAIVDRLSRLLGLDVSVRSRLGKGTVFSLHIPSGALADDR